MESSYPSEMDRETANQMLYYLHRGERIPVHEEDPYAHLPITLESDMAADIERRRKAVAAYDPGTETESSSEADSDTTDTDNDGDSDELPSYTHSNRRPISSSSPEPRDLPEQDEGKKKAADVPVHSSQFIASEGEHLNEDEEGSHASRKTILASQVQPETPSARPFCPDCLHASTHTSPSTRPSPACTCRPCLSPNLHRKPQACVCLVDRSQIILRLSDLVTVLSSAFLHNPAATHGQRQIYTLVTSTLNSIQSNPRKAVAEYYGRETFRDWACYVDFWAAKNDDITDAWMELQWITFVDGEGLEMLTHRGLGRRRRRN
ncbi:hypothetical protein DL546_006171 [Coniochaeta pulveracea]|uniref:Uncharacterized protein n=1 Tax=Coniochaeta pulveracea TaxID=177199 RepID=A0A420Y6Y7_9PEZI|nr:hypothetical protein DL546_006171 [Coniochaeta pulveracea]